MTVERPLSPFPQLAYGTPRKLPRAKSLPGRVVVLDVAFAANAGGASFEGVTKPFLDGLGDRLAMWIDHHDHEMHERYADDPVLTDDNSLTIAYISVKDTATLLIAENQSNNGNRLH